MQYILNRNIQPNGDYEVHNLSSGCSWIPLPQNQINLGNHPSCKEAVVYAKSQNPNVKINGCKYCCGACHTS